MLEISRDGLRAIEEHGRRDYPDECCGILLGIANGSDARVESVRDVPNVKEGERKRRFVIAPGEYLAAERAARDAGLALLGFYHSHPDHPARPSEFDREHAWPNLHYVILRVAQGVPETSTSWVLAEDRSVFHEEELRITEGD